MADTVDLIVKNGTVVTSDSTFDADIAIKDGKFVEIADPGTLTATAAEEYDAAGKYVIPGVIDGHVHFREPGLEYKEDWRTGSTAAIHGGVTTVIEMPNTNPKTDTVAGVELKQKLAEEKSYVDFGIIGLLVQDSVPALRSLAEAGVVGYKCFLGETIGNIPAPDDGMMLDGLREIAATGLRIGFHAENNEIMQHLIRQLKAEGRTDPLAHVDSRPALAEVESIQRMGLYAQHTGAKMHIFHLSSRDGLDMIDEWRAKGVDVTTETGAHYVFMKAEDMERVGVRLRMNPPVRYGTEGHGDYLLEGIKDGRVNMIATDHSPHTAEEKLNDDIWKAISGFPGVETSVRFFLTFGVNAGRMTLQQFVRASSEGPAKTWDIYPQKGTIAVGSDGDLTILDLDKEGVIRDDELHSKNHVTPFDGTATKGAPVATIVRGQIVMRDGEVVGEARGRMVRPRVAVPA
ncbi:MAG TPA: allantoinase AllB [Candidatus Saccharimonadales bacterium]|nr:allantoinase AllB [Candidatus Saccharimonadales bacterium]